MTTVFERTDAYKSKTGFNVDHEKINCVEATCADGQTAKLCVNQLESRIVD